MTKEEFQNLKVGDKINVLQHYQQYCASDGGHLFNGLNITTEVGEVDRIEGIVIHFTASYQKQSMGVYQCAHNYNEIRPQVGLDVFSINKTNNKKSMSSNVLDFFRNMAASAEEKLLKEFGVEDPIGTPTEAGLKLAQEIQYKTVRPQIIEVVKKMKEEQEKNKE